MKNLNNNEVVYFTSLQPLKPHSNILALFFNFENDQRVHGPAQLQHLSQSESSLHST